MINDNAEKIRGMLVDALEGTEHLLKHYPNGFISSDIESVGSFINSAISLLPKPCETCGGSRKKLTSGFCNMIHKYIPCPACCQAPAGEVEEFVKELQKERNCWSKNNSTGQIIEQACTHLTALLKQIKELKRPMESAGFNTDGMRAVGQELINRDKQIEELEAKIEGQFHYKYCKVHKTIYCLEQGDCPLCLQAKIKELEGEKKGLKEFMRYVANDCLEIHQNHLKRKIGKALQEEAEDG